MNKLTLLDYPGKVAATIFLGSCNFRCPFCHNGGLVLAPQEEPEISMEEIRAFLRKRQGILDGICITGGEPTLSRELPELIREVRSLGYLVKLDTNGSRPSVLRRLLEEQLVDCIAMDIKSSLENYEKVSGISRLNLDEICESVDLIREKAPDYEFRTTVVKELHNREDFEAIGKWLSGVKAYYLQAYKDSDMVIQTGYHSYSREEMEAFAGLLRRTIPRVEIRGMD